MNTYGLNSFINNLKNADVYKNTYASSIYSNIGRRGKDGVIELKTIQGFGDHPETNNAINYLAKEIGLKGFGRSEYQGIYIALSRFLRNFLDKVDGKKDLAVNIKQALLRIKHYPHKISKQFNEYIKNEKSFYKKYPIAGFERVLNLIIKKYSLQRFI